MNPGTRSSSSLGSSQHLLLWLFLFGIGSVRVVHGVRQVQVLTRHGAREHLQKTASFAAPERGGLLTVQGENQLEQLGVWLQMRYNHNHTNNTNSNNDSNSSVLRLNVTRVSSSATQRTIVSAMSLVRGYANNATNIPVYSTPEVHDIDIRAYDKCPTFTDHLESLYEKDEAWNKMEISVEGILKRLATIDRYASYVDTEKEIIPLENAWNVFDDIAICEGGSGQTLEYCLRTSDSDDTPILSNEEWSQLQTVIHQAELARYHSATAGNLIGRNLLFRIAEENRSGMFVYSGHYPTLLGVMAELNIADWFSPDDPNNNNRNVIPSFASALLWEEQDDGQYEIYFKSGDSNRAVLLRKWDHRSDFVTNVMMGKNSTDESSSWCRLCRNQSADVCVLLRSLMNQQHPEDDDDDGPSFNSTVAGFFLGIGLGALLVVSYRTFRTTCQNRRRRRKHEGHTKQERDSTTLGDDNHHHISEIGTSLSSSRPNNSSTDHPRREHSSFELELKPIE